MSMNITCKLNYTWLTMAEKLIFLTKKKNYFFKITVEFFIYMLHYTCGKKYLDFKIVINHCKRNHAVALHMYSTRMNYTFFSTHNNKIHWKIKLPIMPSKLFYTNCAY